MTSAKMKLNYYDRPWPFTENYFCDLHFVQYLERNKVEGKLIFHFGTGDHHLVGRSNYERGNPNEILAITASREEHDAYIDFIIDNPKAANHYKVLFGDIYTLSERGLPAFDLVTLFELGQSYDMGECSETQEFWRDGRSNTSNPRLNSAYARLNDATLLELFLSRLSPEGKIFFYKESGGFRDNPQKAAAIVTDFVSGRRMVVEDEFESLLICRRAK